MARVEFEDKINTRALGAPENTKVTAGNLNELKNSVNALYDQAVWTVELVDALTVDFYAPYPLKIDTISHVLNDPEIEIKLNDEPYTLGEEIEPGDKLTVSVDLVSVINLNVSSVQ